MKTLQISNQILTEDTKHTFLSADVASGDGTIDVKNIAGFSTDQPLLLEPLGSEKSEIVKTDSSTSPSDGTITLNSSTDFDHSQGTKVTILEWNQVEISHASTKDGSKSVLDTIDIQPDQLETQYTDSSKSDGFYFVRFKNDIDGAYSLYSDPIPYGDYDTNQVGHLINYALNRNKLDDFTDNITKEFCIDEINGCLKQIRGSRKKWHSLQEFDYELGTLTDGTQTIDCPPEMWGYSDKSILELYLEDGTVLEHIDEKETNERDDDKGKPKYYTVKDESIYLYPIPDGDADGTKLMVDFWKEAPEVDSMGDELDIMRYDMVKYYLTAAIRWQRQNDGAMDQEDGDYLRYQRMLNQANIIENQTSGEDYGWKPKLNTIEFHNA